MPSSINLSTHQEAHIEHDAILEDDIQFLAPLSQHYLAPKAVFLTGATGLLGVYILDELLRTSSANIYCLVRAIDEEFAQQRLINHLTSYGLYNEEYFDRILPVIGDLTEPFFGLDEHIYNELAAEIDVVYYSAGWINMLYPYSRLKPANVLGVKEAIRFAGLNQTKPLHFVSSIAVFFNSADNTENQILTEADVPAFHASLKGGYGKSKWVGDRLVAAAQERGLPATIHRPTRIMGHSITGALNDNSELLPQLLKGCIKLGCYPTWDIEVTMVPVDYISSTMVHLAASPANFGKAFHYFNPYPIRWLDLIALVNAQGYDLKEITYEQWLAELKKAIDSPEESHLEDREFYSRLLLALKVPHYLFYKRPHFDSKNIAEGIAGTDISCHKIDNELISRYIHYWQKTGFCPKP
ncbi:MAG: thioester reductase domain-containing protein [Methylovulum sp.]|jgi:thioester reductase-like protein|nr:thioester reductase domain-containing protein [Methylovulum sp.]TSA39750.1 MAG: NAD-dependent epimerase/dehydratase family protein [Methylococcaceae bacterium]